MKKVQLKLEYNGVVNTKLYWMIPLILGVGFRVINSGSRIYFLQLTPFLEVAVSKLGTGNGSVENK